MQLKTIFGVLALASMGLTSPTPNPDVEGFEERDLEEWPFGTSKLYCCKSKIKNIIPWIKVPGVGLDCVETQSPNSNCYHPRSIKCFSNFPYDPKNQVCNSFG